MTYLSRKAEKSWGLKNYLLLALKEMNGKMCWLSVCCTGKNLTENLGLSTTFPKSFSDKCIWRIWLFQNAGTYACPCYVGKFLCADEIIFRENASCPNFNFCGGSVIWRFCYQIMDLNLFHWENVLSLIFMFQSFCIDGQWDCSVSELAASSVQWIRVSFLIS